MSVSGTKNGLESAPLESGSNLAWFCLRSQPKHEHIAARHLRLMEGVEVFNPRIRFARATRTGPLWVTEALFPNYLFARFDWKTSLTRVHYSPGVSGVVHFGSRWPTVPERSIEEIRAMLGRHSNLVIITGDRHWQYVSTDKPTGLEEWSVGPATDSHAGGWPEDTPRPEHRFLRTKHDGFLSGEVKPAAGGAPLTLRLHDTAGKVVFESTRPGGN